MKVIVDTCVWSNALRNQPKEAIHKDLLLEQLIEQYPLNYYNKHYSWILRIRII